VLAVKIELSDNEMEASRAIPKIVQNGSTLRVTKSFSPKQAARAIGVSEASLKRWCDQGLLVAQRTVGGHRRLSLAEVLNFLRDTKREPVRPEILGLPAVVGQGKTTIDRALAQTVSALVAGDEDQLRQLFFNLYLAKIPIREICDRVIAPAFQQIGHQWQAGRLEVYRERRACEICARGLLELRTLLPAPASTGPLAIGATLFGDPYQLPTLMVEVALRELGWQAQSLGTGLPFSTACAALQEVKPRLFWLSVSSIPGLAEFLSEYEKFQAIAAAADISIVVGGRALTKTIRRNLHYAAFCDGLGHLASFIRAFR
jgi:MerR family transcriptional regulator, light-induced transcriptional regulator